MAGTEKGTCGVLATVPDAAGERRANAIQATCAVRDVNSISVIGALAPIVTANGAVRTRITGRALAVDIRDKVKVWVTVYALTVIVAARTLVIISTSMNRMPTMASATTTAATTYRRHTLAEITAAAIVPIAAAKAIKNVATRHIDGLENDFAAAVSHVTIKSALTIKVTAAAFSPSATLISRPNGMAATTSGAALWVFFVTA